MHHITGNQDKTFTDNEPDPSSFVSFFSGAICDAGSYTAQSAYLPAHVLQSDF